MEESKMKIIGITKDMELHIHGNTGKQEWYTNLSIPGILDILAEFTEGEDSLETDMLDHLAVYFYNRIPKEKK